MKTFIRDQKGFLIAGLLLALYLSPMYILGGDMHVRTHDNLDSNVVWYKILAESGKIFAPIGSTLPYAINGLPRIALPSEFTFMLWLYVWFDPITANIINSTLLRVVAFIGMYLLLRRHVIPAKKTQFICIGAALCYAILPYWVPGGLTIAGLPLALYAFLNIRNRQSGIKDWLIIGLLPFYSNFILSFFFFLFLMGVLWLWDVFKKQRNWKFFSAIVLMTALYLIKDYRLVYTMLFGYPFVPHRVEFNLGHLDLDSTLRLIKKNFMEGHTHVYTEHKFIVLPTLIAAFFAAVIKKAHPKKLLATFFLIVLFCVEYAFWYWEGMRLLKDNIQFFNTFNMSRFHFLHPPLWYIAFALSLYWLYRLLQRGRNIALLVIGLQVAVLFAFNPEVKYRYVGNLSYNEFYSVELFQNIQEYIGRDPSDYRVVSIGIHPTIAQYNGFYTLDTYNNIYPLEYKHQFRKVIAPELKKSETLRKYYDRWGGRCYIFIAQFGKNYAITKNENVVLKDLDLNTAVLKKMGGDYVLSSVPIKDAEEEQLDLVHVFETKSSPWRIHLYKVAVST